MNHSLLRCWVGIIASVFMLQPLMAATSLREQAIEQRIAPVAEVSTVAAEDSNVTEKLVVAEFNPEARYKKVCALCHQAGVAGAPMIGNKKQWAPRIEKGMDTLVSHVINGFKAMPARGACVDCTNEEIEKIVRWMVEQSQ